MIHIATELHYFTPYKLYKPLRLSLPKVSVPISKFVCCFVRFACCVSFSSFACVANFARKNEMCLMCFAN